MEREQGRRPAGRLVCGAQAEVWQGMSRTWGPARADPSRSGQVSSKRSTKVSALVGLSLKSSPCQHPAPNPLQTAPG